MKTLTTDQLFERWYQNHVSKGCTTRMLGEQYKTLVKWAWIAGRREGMRYPWGRKGESRAEYFTRGNL